MFFSAKMTASHNTAPVNTTKGVSYGHILEEFKEVKEIEGIISNIVNIYTDQIAVEMAVEKYLCEYVY